MPYTPPIVAIFQEFNQTPTEVTNPLRAAIIGPNARMHRFSVPAEQTTIAVGAYNKDLDTAYNWPGRANGAKVDRSSAKVYVKDGLLRYYQDLIGAGSTLAPVANHRNKVALAAGAWKTANGTSRLAALLDRDVQIGDVVKVVGGGDTITTYVKDIEYATVAASVGTAAADTANPNTAVAAATPTQTAGPVNNLVLTVDDADYNSLIDGVLTDTYTITVLHGSTGGDLTTAIVKVTTASGYEFSGNFAPGAVDTEKAFGIRGLSFGWEFDALVTPDVGADVDDLIAGQVFQIAITMAFTKPTITSGGTYTGPDTTDYIVTVTSGGEFADTDVNKRPRVSVRTALGTDAIPTITLDALSEVVPLGTGGATLTFSGAGVAGLRKGDVYYVPVTAATAGRASTLVLGNDLTATQRGLSDLDVELFIKSTVEIQQDQILPTARVNWTMTDTQLTLKADCTAYHSSWTNGGVPAALSIIDGTVHIEFTEWLSDFVGTLGRVTLSGVSTIPGQLEIGNPLKDGVNLAASNSNGTAVIFTAVSDPTSLDAWVAAFRVMAGVRDAYSLVVMSDDKAVQDALQAHISEQSNPYIGRRRRAFVPLPTIETSVVIDSAHTTNTAVATGTIADDPGTGGNQYTVLTITSGNAGFVTKNVRPNDEVRTNYTLDALGQVVYDTYQVDVVLSEDSLRLKAGPAGAVSVAQKFEIWHPNTTQEIIDATGQRAGSFADRRISPVWCDFTNVPGQFYPNARACAATAGLASGIPQHQGLTTLPLIGLGAVERNKLTLQTTQLDMLAEYGVLIVSLEDSGATEIRDGLTSDMGSLETKNEMFTRNFDACTVVFQERLRRFRGRSNNVRSAQDEIRLEITNIVEFLRSTAFTARLGSPIIDATLVELRPHLLDKNRLVFGMQFEFPFEIKQIEGHLVG